MYFNFSDGVLASMTLQDAPSCSNNDQTCTVPHLENSNRCKALINQCSRISFQFEEEKNLICQKIKKKGNKISARKGFKTCRGHSSKSKGVLSVTIDLRNKYSNTLRWNLNPHQKGWFSTGSFTEHSSSNDTCVWEMDQRGWLRIVTWANLIHILHQAHCVFMSFHA